MKPFLMIPSVVPIRRPGYGPPPAPHVSGRLTCEGCTHCCHYVAIEIDRPTGKRDFDNLFWFLLHDGVSVYIDHGARWFVQFDTTCRALTSEGRCGVYEERPQVCRDYALDECVRHNDTPPEKHLFRSPEELQAYLDQRGIDWRWKRRPATKAS
jgi:Fe-S-cluster containining protein